MLEVAVADLWKFEKKASEKKESEDESLQALGMAIAKVQFVQVFLQDSTLPLPPEEGAKSPNKEAVTGGEPVLKLEQAPQAAPEPPPNDVVSQSSLPAKAMPQPLEQPIAVLAPPPIAMSTRPAANRTPHASLPTTSLSSEHASGTPVTSLSPQQGRPRLEQSSFSWMLGQAHEHRHSFIDPSPFSPGEKRFHAAHGGDEKGFLFGEENDVVGEPKPVEKGKGKEKKRNSSVLRAREDIGLGDMAGGPTMED